MARRSIRTILVISITLFLFLYNWLYEAEQSTHSMPEYARREIYPWVERRDLSNQQLHMIAHQTGLNPKVVAELLLGNKGFELLCLQAAYYSPVKTVSELSSLLTLSEYVVDEEGNYKKATHFADIRKGDILITKNSRFLGWRNGHVGLVVDSRKGLVLEALMPGTNTRVCSLDKWEMLPSFQVLRIKEGVLCSELERICYSTMVVEYAMENLVDIPYSLMAGLPPEEMSISKTHCAHLIWYAYKQFGIDLDSDGGNIVTPEDIRKSPYLEVIQSFGY